MTRLRGEWMRVMISAMDEHERALKAATGLDYTGMAAAANGLSREDILGAAAKHTAAVVPVTQGQGLIEDFAAGVALILQKAGFTARVTDATDVDGIYEAHTAGDDVVFMADDARYIGMRLDRRVIADNNICTARGFVTALEAAAGGLASREVLVCGCGIIGRMAGKCLVAKGAYPVYYDTDAVRLDRIARVGAKTCRDISSIGRFGLIFDATNTGRWLHAGMLMPDALVAAPGVPNLADEAAAALYGARIMHDDLETGTAAMLGALFAG